MNVIRPGLAGLVILALAAGCGFPQPSAQAASPSQFAAGTAAVQPTVPPSPAPSPTSSLSGAARWPRVTCAPPASVPPSWTLMCASAVAAAEALVGPDPGTASIEFGYGPWCPPAAQAPKCPGLELPNTGWVAFHRLTLDPSAVLWVVAVQADAAGRVTASWVRLPSPYASPAG